MATPRRFIAGAVCPRCAEMDRIVMYSNEKGQFRECVACGFADREGEREPAVAELQTRVNSRINTDDHTVKQVVFFRAADADDDSSEQS